MNKLVRYEFLGNWWLLLLYSLLCAFVIGFPMVTYYLLTRTVKVTEHMDNPSTFLEAMKSGKIVEPS